MELAKSNSNLKGLSVFWDVIFNGIFIIWTVFCVVPLLLIISVSLSDEQTIAIHGYKFIPEKFSTYAYEFVITAGGDILRAYGITIGVTVVGTILSVIVIAMYAYPLSRKDFKYRKHFSMFVFFTMIFNGGLVPWYMVYTSFLKLQDNLLVYIIPLLVSAWYVLIMRTFFVTTIPDALIESARIDGAGEFRTFVQIVLPLAKPGIATVALFQTLAYWNDWYIALLFIEDGKKYNIPFLMQRTLMNLQYMATNTNLSRAGIDMSKLPSETARMALCVLAVGPIIFVYPFFQKYFIQGLTIGAVKG